MRVNEPMLIRGPFRDKDGKYRVIPCRYRRKLLKAIHKGIEKLDLGCNRILVSYEEYADDDYMLRIMLARVDESALPQNCYTIKVVNPSGLDDPEAKQIVDKVIEPSCQKILSGRYSFELSTL